MLARLARVCVRHRWIVIGTWLALLVGINAIAGAVGPDYRTDFTLPDSESKVVQDLLEANDPNRAGFISQIVAKADQGVDDPEVQATLEQIYDFSASQDGITVTSPYDNPQQVSADGTINFAQLDVADRGFEEVIDARRGDRRVRRQPAARRRAGDRVRRRHLLRVRAARERDLRPARGRHHPHPRLRFGARHGPARSAPRCSGSASASALVSLGSNVISMPDFTTAMVAMIGIGVGIDYTLFIVTRYREGLRLGLDVEESVVEAMDTSGRAVLFAGATVIISLLGLCLMGLDFVQGVAIASSIGVLMMVLGSLTLLPALLGWVGTRIDHTTRAALIAVAVVVVATFVGVATGQAPIFFVGLLGSDHLLRPQLRDQAVAQARPAPRRATQATSGFWYRWSRFIQHRPWPSALSAVAILVLLALPLFGIRLGFGDYGNYPESKTVRRAYDLLAEGFGPGTNGPLFIAVEGDAAADPQQLQALRPDDPGDRRTSTSSCRPRSTTSWRWSSSTPTAHRRTPRPGPW